MKEEKNIEDPLNHPSSFIDEKAESFKSEINNQIDVTEEIKTSSMDLNYDNIFEVNLFLKIIVTKVVENQKHLEFEIERTVNNSEKFYCFKRYSQFYWFKVYLERKWRGIYFPPIPEAKRLSNYSVEEVKLLKTKIINDFCKNIVNMKYICNSVDFNLFFIENEDFQKKCDLLPSESMSEIVQRTKLLLGPNLKLFQNSEKEELSFPDINEFYNNCKQSIKSFEENIRAIANERESKKAEHSILITTLTNLSRFEKVELNKILPNLSDRLVFNVPENEAKVKSLDIPLEDLLKHYYEFEFFFRIAIYKMEEIICLFEAINQLRTSKDKNMTSIIDDEESSTKIKLGRTTFKTLFSSTSEKFKHITNLEKKIEIGKKDHISYILYINLFKLYIHKALQKYLKRTLSEDYTSAVRFYIEEKEKLNAKYRNTFDKILETESLKTHKKIQDKP